ncbi:MAG: leucine-rich repeat domain-containing protein [Clostridia bacterium]|nr:leucine-rich repeat domain-containing protein [Clostridia bacterium]
MKKISQCICFTISFIVLLSFQGCNRQPHARLEEGDYTLSLVSDNQASPTYYIVKYDGTDENITLPNKTDKGYPIIAVGSWAFAGCESIKNLIIPDGFVSLEKNSFYNCSNLESVFIGANVASISEWEVFSSCERLQTFSVNTDNCVFYAKGNCLIDKTSQTVVYGCKDSIIPNEIKRIGACAFSEIDTLEKIVIPESVTHIGSFAFFKATSLNEVTLGDNIEHIGDSAFGECPELVIYCKFVSKPDGWSDTWIHSSTTVIWDS